MHAQGLSRRSGEEPPALRRDAPLHPRRRERLRGLDRRDGRWAPSSARGAIEVRDLPNRAGYPRPHHREVPPRLLAPPAPGLRPRGTLDGSGRLRARLLPDVGEVRARRADRGKAAPAAFGAPHGLRGAAREPRPHRRAPGPHLPREPERAALRDPRKARPGLSSSQFSSSQFSAGSCRNSTTVAQFQRWPTENWEPGTENRFTVLPRSDYHVRVNRPLRRLRPARCTELDPMDHGDIGSRVLEEEDLLAVDERPGNVHLALAAPLETDSEPSGLLPP